MNEEFKGPIFSDESLRSELSKLEEIPKSHGEVGVAATPGDIGVEGSVSKPIGKGWEVEAQGSWYLKAKAKVAALLTWTGK